MSVLLVVIALVAAVAALAYFVMGGSESLKKVEQKQTPKPVPTTTTVKKAEPKVTVPKETPVVAKTTAPTPKVVPKVEAKPEKVEKVAPVTTTKKVVEKVAEKKTESKKEVTKTVAPVETKKKEVVVSSEPKDNAGFSLVEKKKTTKKAPQPSFQPIKVEDRPKPKKLHKDPTDVKVETKVEDQKKEPVKTERPEPFVILKTIKSEEDFWGSAKSQVVNE